jgi:hypothetical protein
VRTAHVTATSRAWSGSSVACASIRAPQDEHTGAVNLDVDWLDFDDVESGWNILLDYYPRWEKEGHDHFSQPQR